MLNLQKNYLQKYQQIYPQNPQWSNIEYKLQLNLGNASIDLKKVYCISNVYLSNMFQRENKGMVTSEVYIKPQSLNGLNRVDRVCQKGFQINQPQGMDFQIGQVQGMGNDKIDNELLIVKICPRKVFPCIDSQKNKELLPPVGFDSIYFKEETKKGIYQHRFRIFKKMQTLPEYLVQFTYNKNHQKKFQKILCQNCNNLEATHYCLTEKVYFCKKCDFSHHKDKISSQHERVTFLDKPIVDFGYCSTHKQNKNEIFCRECNLSICMSCKINGMHSQDPMRDHSLQKIFDYFQKISIKVNEMQPNLEKRKDQFQEMLKLIDEKIKNVNNRTIAVQKQLTTMFQESLLSLQIITRRKLSYLIADQLQIRRQYDYIQWMQSFLKYQFDVLPPNNFLVSWTKHMKLRKDILNASFIPVITDVKADFKIQGKIDVIEESKVSIFQSNELDGTKKTILQNQLLQTDRIIPAEVSKRDVSILKRKIFQDHQP